MIDTVVLINKASGITSFSCLNYLKRYVHKKTGHCGTLDKFASGLLIACCGKYTKFVPMFMGLDKTYIALIEFGKETDTLDPEGTVIDEKPIPSFSVIFDAVSNYIGKIIQVPPAFSALHINGKRSYELARAGVDIAPQGREIEIFSADIIDYSAPYLTVLLRVSKGTYVRSYARDLGKLCGSCAYVKELKRTQIGPFSLSEAVDYNDISAFQNLNDGSSEALITGKKLIDRLSKNDFTSVL